MESGKQKLGSSAAENRLVANVIVKVPTPRHAQEYSYSKRPRSSI